MTNCVLPGVRQEVGLRFIEELVWSDEYSASQALIAIVDLKVFEKNLTSIPRKKRGKLVSTIVIELRFFALDLADEVLFPSGIVLGKSATGFDDGWLAEGRHFVRL